MSVEKIIIILVIFSFFLTSINVLGMQGDVLTREEAIEISKNSSLVQEGLAKAYYATIETHFYNSQRIEELKEWHSNEIFKNVPKDAFWEEKVPEGHSVWEVIWYFKEGVGGYTVVVIVDAKVGVIITEAMGVKFL